MGETIRRLFNRGIRALYRPPISAEEVMFDPFIINCDQKNASNNHQSSIACESIYQEQIFMYQTMNLIAIHMPNACVSLS